VIITSLSNKRAAPTLHVNESLLCFGDEMSSLELGVWSICFIPALGSAKSRGWSGGSGRNQNERSEGDLTFERLEDELM
jgi:hypothetical protein